MARLIRKAKQYGFTLVELLIVVAIIGVLSTIGVPSFRRMVQKSKKSEAKVNLGGLYTAEQAFFSEYGAFGNNIGRMGYQIDGNPTNLMYRVGFLNAGCATQVAANGNNSLPGVATDYGKAINQAFPTYYNDPQGASGSRAGNTTLTQCTAPGNLGAAFVSGGVNGQNTVYSVPVASNSFNRFVATAYGVIAPGVDKVGPAANLVDVWAINDGRTAVNLQDGVQ